MKTKTILAVSGLLFAIGCGGSGGGGDNIPSYAQLLDDAESLETTLNSDFDNENYTDLSTLPMSGGGTYEGVIGLDSENIASAADAGALGELELRLSLRDDTITGEAINFRTADGGRVTGSLDVDMTLNRDVDVTDTYSWTGSLTGELTNDINETATFDGFIRGDLYRDDRSALIGDVGGGLNAGAGPENLFGIWGAELQD